MIIKMTIYVNIIGDKDTILSLFLYFLKKRIKPKNH